MSLPSGFLDTLRSKLSLAEVVSRRVKWDYRKSNPEKGDFWASCPFHEEDGVSFHVDDRKGFYYCFGCHAKGDALSFLRETENESFMGAVRRLAFVYGMEGELDRMHDPDQDKLGLIQLKNIIVEKFDQERWFEVGVITGWTRQIRNHDRLLRSLSWGDADYAGHVLDLLTAMDDQDDGSIERLRRYVESNFAIEVKSASDVVALSEINKHLGYRYQKPRNDAIAVMMPFRPEFSPVYEAIKEACAATPLPVKRADEVWNHSAVINDILELINHAAVVVCDLTGRNENVFYELGIAHAWGKPVVPITQSGGDVPFDLLHHRYLGYLNNSEGRTQLTKGLTERLTRLVGTKR